MSGQNGVSALNHVGVGPGSGARAARQREAAVNWTRKSVTQRTAILSPNYKVKKVKMLMMLS